MSQGSTDAAGEQLLTASGLSKAFAGVHALDDVSFDVRPGEVHALLGENGAGKSTLVKLVSGVMRADRGEVAFRGRPFAPRDPAEALRAGVGVVFQELPLLPDMTVMENIYFGRQPLTRLRTVSRRQLRSHADELFGRLQLHGINPTRHLRDLSVAARQLVAIAKVLAADPQVVVFDEATSALGPSDVAWLFEQTRSLAEAGRGIVFISHRLAEVDEISDRVTVLRNGTRVGTWTAGEVTSDGLISAMLGRRLGQLYPEQRGSPQPRPVLEVRGLATGRRLRGVDLAVHAGEVLGLCGLEGQGQLELFLSIYGVTKARGSISIDGKARRIRSPRDALRAGIGLALVPEDRKNEGVLPSLSIRENLALPSLHHLGRFGFISQDAEREFIAPAMADLRIGTGDPEQQVGGLSGGNQQKVVVGKFLLTGAKVLLLYDLTRGVDVGTKAEIFRMMAELAEQGYAILFYSSDLAEIENMPHRVSAMFDGKVVAEFRHGSFTQEDLVAAMVGRSAAPAARSANGSKTGHAAQDPPIVTSTQNSRETER